MSVIMIGATVPAALEGAARTVFSDASSTCFDSVTETWTVEATDGRVATASVVVDVRPSSNRAVASHGFPNYFRTPGPNLDRQSRYVARCLRMIERSGAERVEAKSRVVLRRWRPEPVASRFYLSGAEPGPDDLYDGPATVTVRGRDSASRVRLTGHLDPVDGQYHWQGTVFDDLPDDVRTGTAGVTLTVEGRTVAARLVERTPWGAHMIAGVGDPPFER